MSAKEKMTDGELAALLDILRQRGQTVTTVESCTGGLLSGRITDIPGSSDVLRQGFVTYCDEAKHRLVGVSQDTLAQYTAVSAQTAREMAEGGARAARAEACLSVTGYAGPSGDPADTSVGLVYVGCFYQGQTKVRECHFPGSRREVREAAVEEALQLLRESMEETPHGRNIEQS